MPLFHIFDIENIVVLLALTVLFVSGLRKRESPLASTDFYHCLSIDLSLTTAIKGIACIFILIGHFGTMNYNDTGTGVVTKAIHLTTANIALTWFMFFSGYGLSLKEYRPSHIKKEWCKRLKKTYLPLL